MKEELRKLFIKNYNYEPYDYMDCGGRFEILGNHTDHNHGLCMAATCDLKISSAVGKREDKIVNLISEGNPSFTIDLTSLEVREDELSTSQGLIRGVAFYLNENGYKYGGFDIYMNSTIFPGAGVSSSAAFELLIGAVFNHLFNEDKIDKMTLCKAGQFAENKYFGKASGLLDQIGVGYGGISYIDFSDINNPVVEEIHPDFKGYHFILVNSGGSHAALSDLYSAIPQDMYTVAHKLGVNFLNETNLEALEKYHKENPHDLRDIELSRARHFFNENERVKKAEKALKNNDINTFLAQVNGCALSQRDLLKNVMVEDHYKGSPLEAMDLADELMAGHGAKKVNGGGFAGSIVAIVPDTYLDNFLKGMKERFGQDNVHEVYVRNLGPSVMLD